MELTRERSEGLAIDIKALVEIARNIDIEYLKASVEAMKDSIHYQESAMVLDPNPHIVIERANLNKAKTKSLEYLLAFCTSQNYILQAEIVLMKARKNSAEIGKLFGL